MNNEINNQVVTEPVTEVPVQQPVKGKGIPKIKLNTKIKLDTKNKKIVAIGLGVFIVLFAVVLFISSKNSTLNMLGTQEEEIIKVNTGVQWGNLYAEFMQKEMVDIATYDVSLVDLNNDETPEMLVEYVDAEEKDDLKIFYINEGEVFTTKVFRTYSLHLLYSVETKDVGWYIYISSNEKYGAYTSLEKIVNGVAFDSDIKANTDKLVEEFTKKYAKSDYKPVFYQINADSFEEDVKNVVSRYDGYKEKINKAKNDLVEKNADREYVETPKEEPNLDYLIFSGRKLHYGKYQATDQYDNVYTIILNNAYTVIIDGSYITYKTVDATLVLADESVIKVPDNDIITYNGMRYKYVPEETVPSVDLPVDNQGTVDQPSTDDNQTVVDGGSNNNESNSDTSIDVPKENTN